MKITYETQRLSLRYFMLMLVIFGVQALYGLLLATQHADPTLLSGIVNFNIVRATHLNLAVLWVVCGFIGTIVFVAPLLSKRDIKHPGLVKLLFYAVIIIAVWNSYTQTLAKEGIAGWWMGQPWLQNGLEYIEVGRIAAIGLLVGFLILAFVVLKTFPPIKRWNELHWGLGIGTCALVFTWIFGMFYAGRIDVQEYFRWYVVHYWVEGVWEVIHITLIGTLTIIMFKASVRAVGFAVFWGVALVWLSGLIGNAHHYFWVGTPEFWQFWGALFSAFEPLPLIFCFWHIYLDAHSNNRPLTNAPAFYFLLGSAVLELVGAGILGFVMTFALTNVWSHGTWITAAHGHLALFGTFGMLGIGAAYWAVPSVRKIANFDQKLGKLAFWMLFTGMLGIALSFAFGGMIQIYVYRILGLDWFGGDLGPAVGIYRFTLPLFAGLFVTGAGVAIYDLITMGNRSEAANEKARLPQAELTDVPAAKGWRRPLTGFEAGIWLAFMCFFGGVLTFSLLSFNLPVVRIEANPTLPYLLSGVGYLGLFGVTLGFIWRFTASMRSRQPLPTQAPPVPDMSVETA